MADSLFQVTGISSGIDWGAIIDKTIEASKKPATQWQKKIDTLEIKKTLYQELSSEFFKLRNTLTPLKLDSTYLNKKAEYYVHSPVGADAAGIVQATPNANAEIAKWELDVKQIAKAQRHISAKVSEPGSALNISGSFRIMEDERWATIEIVSSDTIRDINVKLQNAKDQFGNPMPITSQLIDNRLVIDSINSGLRQADNKAAEQLKMSSSNLMYLPRAGINYSKTDADGNYVQSSYPPRLLSVYSGSTEYREGTDFDYDPEQGLITWKTGTGAARPETGAEVNLLYSTKATVTAGSAGIDLLPYLHTGEAYDDGITAGLKTVNVAVYKPNGGRYVAYDASDPTADWDYKIVYGEDDTGAPDPLGGVIVWNDGSDGTSTVNPPPTAGQEYTILINSDVDYSTSQNKFYLEEDNMSENSVLARLGFVTFDEDAEEWGYTEGSCIEAQDAVFYINDVPVTKQTNEIDDIIANVKLELKGEGKVTVNITQDAEKAVENMQAFVDQYNMVMTWINTYLSQKADATSTDDGTSVLSELLSNTKGNTVFGPLHGDSLLWSMKNQLRNLISNPVTTMSRTLNSKKFLHPAESLNMQGSFYIHVGGMSARINLSPEDSLTDLQNKLNGAVNGVSDIKGAKPGEPKSLGLEASIVDGQLIIGSKPVSSENKTKTADGKTVKSPMATLTRDSEKTGVNYDYLTFTPQTSSPINGEVKVYDGTTEYVEGKDYRLVTEENADGVITSKIVWLTGGNMPKTGGTVAVDYSYYESAVGISYIEDSANTLSGLNLHNDASKTVLSKYGITTESIDYGKSGLLEFDSDVFFEAIKEDSKTVAMVMTNFMRDVMDVYIGNIVDSTDVMVAGTAVTKGRVASELKSIDTEIASLNDQITKLEKSLATKQSALYKRYTDMEMAIQKLNSQLSSMTQYFSNMNGSS